MITTLLALQALRRIENKFGLRLDLRVLFQESLAEIATRCQSERVARDGGHGVGKAAKPKVVPSVRIKSESSAFGSLSQEVDFLYWREVWREHVEPGQNTVNC